MKKTIICACSLPQNFMRSNCRTVRTKESKVRLALLKLANLPHDQGLKVIVPKGVSRTIRTASFYSAAARLGMRISCNLTPKGFIVSRRKIKEYENVQTQKS